MEDKYPKKKQIKISRVGEPKYFAGMFRKGRTQAN